MQITKISGYSVQKSNYSMPSSKGMTMTKQETKLYNWAFNELKENYFPRIAMCNLETAQAVVNDIGKEFQELVFKTFPRFEEGKAVYNKLWGRVTREFIAAHDKLEKIPEGVKLFALGDTGADILECSVLRDRALAAGDMEKAMRYETMRKANVGIRDGQIAKNREIMAKHDVLDAYELLYQPKTSTEVDAYLKDREVQQALVNKRLAKKGVRG